MSDNDKYNGWSNRETWLCNLWRTNAQGYEYEERELLEAYGKDAYDISKELENEYEEYLAELGIDNGLFSDLLSTALGRIDFYEIAQSIIDDYPDDYNEEEESEE